MVWNQPLVWADGDLPSATEFNQQFRDNFNELALHNHGGGSGSGTARLGPLEGATFVGTPPPPTSADHLSIGDVGGTFAWVTSATATFLAANSTHEHTGSWVQEIGEVNRQATGATLHSIVTEWSPNGLTDVGSIYATGTITVGGSGSRAVFAAGVMTFDPQTGAVRPGTVEFLRSLNGTGETVLDSTAASDLFNGTQLHRFAFTWAGTAVVSGSYLFYFRALSTNTVNTPVPVYGSVFISEFQIK